MNPIEPADHGALGAILAMAGATYAMRAGGFWLMGHVPLRVERMLAALPGSIIAATVLPIIANGGLVGALAIGGAALVMALRRNDFLAVIAGMSIAAAARRRRIVTARTAWKGRCRPTFFRTAAN